MFFCLFSFSLSPAGVLSVVENGWLTKLTRTHTLRFPENFRVETFFAEKKAKNKQQQEQA